MSFRASLGGGAWCALLAVSCSASSGQPTAVTESDVVLQYALNLRANYQDVVAKLVDLQSAVDAFVAAPSQDGFDSARAAWLACRPTYGQCEISRFYGGPLDQAQGRMNEWPLDENFLDYTYGIPDGGIVNQPDAYPVIDVALLKSTDHMGGLENLPAGFHAIEFLLWGQRPSQSDGPGARPYTDYVDGGTAANQSPNHVWDVAKQAIVLGRFGWKANQPTLAQQTFAAFRNDIGITSELFPDKNCGPTQTDCLDAPMSLTIPNIQDPKANAMVVHALGLAVPARRNLDDAQALHGEELFGQIGCGSCHIQKMVTGVLPEWPELSNQTIRPYTDLLLHDMGSDLADGRPDFEATGSEWRTPPLWGLGLSGVIDGYLFLLHDGRARNFAEAILWHAGQAKAARDSFRTLAKSDRDALVAFLQSL